jgi:hypothetical protein
LVKCRETYSRDYLLQQQFTGPLLSLFFFLKFLSQPKVNGKISRPKSTVIQIGE